MAASLDELQDKTLFITSGLVSGEWRFGTTQFPVYEPASATILSSCSDLTHDDLIQAIDSAEVGSKKFFESTTAKQRGEILRRWFDLVVSNADDCS